MSRCRLGTRSRRCDPRSTCKEVANEHRAMEHPPPAINRGSLDRVRRRLRRVGADQRHQTLDNGAVGESARGYAIMNKENLWGPLNELRLSARAARPSPTRGDH